MFEPSTGTACAFTPQNGHRYLILTQNGTVGVGVMTQTVGDFGTGSVPYKIPSAAHYPQQASSVDLWANWYDSGGPRSANAVLDGLRSAVPWHRLKGGGEPPHSEGYGTGNPSRSSTSLACNAASTSIFPRLRGERSKALPKKSSGFLYGWM